MKLIPFSVLVAAIVGGIYSLIGKASGKQTMMKYTGKYYRMLTLFMKKYLKEQYGKDITKAYWIEQ